MLQKLDILSPALSTTPIFNKTSQLVLPIQFCFGQGFHIPTFNLIYQCNSKVFITAALSPIVVAETPYLFLYFLLMVAVSSFKGGLCFSNVLAMAFLASSQIYDIRAVTIQLMLDVVAFLGVCTLERFPLLQNRTGNPAVTTLGAARVLTSGGLVRFPLSQPTDLPKFSDTL
jgi:hypothetical protein